MANQIIRQRNRNFRNNPPITPSSKSCNRCGGKGHTCVECRRSKGKTCSFYGKIGHFQIVCQTQLRNPHMQPPNRQHPSSQPSNNRTLNNNQRNYRGPFGNSRQNYTTTNINQQDNQSQHDSLQHAEHHTTGCP